MLALRPCLLALALASTALACKPGTAIYEPNEQVRTFTFEIGVDLAGTPEQAWEDFTGDISPWWDHTFSETPEHLVLDARVGGSFYETFDKEGNGSEHARIIYAERPKMIRMDGPLGLSGLAVHMVHELRFSEREGGGSRVDLRVSVLLPTSSMAKVIQSAMALLPMSFPVRVTRDVDDAETFVGIALPTQQPVGHVDSGANQRAPSH